MSHAENGPLPVTNCHAHIFTVTDVPPKLAKSILPAPLPWVFQIHWLAGLVRYYTTRRTKIRRRGWYKKTGLFLYRLRMALKRFFVLRLLKAMVILLILGSAFHDQYAGRISPFLQENGLPAGWADKLNEWVQAFPWLIKTTSTLIKIFFLLVLLALFPAGKNLLFAFLRQTNRFFKLLPGKQTREMLKRYLNIVRYANYKQQSRVLSRMRLQYPPGSRHVILPMDMAYMGAGKPPRAYAEQMADLAKIHAEYPEEIFPFVFVDPRRMEEEGDRFFNYTIKDGQVVLGDCFIRDYIETKRFSGFKIYPALGYYPFDERLLPLWKYAADNGIPIMTHCIRGVIYYRGRKKKEWDFHPVFEHFLGEDEEPKDSDYQPMLLPQMKAADVQEIFTHPMNYVCLYKKELLAKLVAKAADPRLKEVFGYDESTKTIQRGLGHLKLCFAHFGGEDEWKKFFESDRTSYGHQLIRYPGKGIDFLYTDGTFKRGKPEQLWKTADWYSVICSLMLQHPHVYADISYILHGDREILPLLRQTLDHPELRFRVLYGSDFFVVRNHKSDKNMLADIRGGLTEKDFYRVACENPVRYLERD